MRSFFPKVGFAVGRHCVPMVGIRDADGRRVAPGLGQLKIGGLY